MYFLPLHLEAKEAQTQSSKVATEEEEQDETWERLDDGVIKKGKKKNEPAKQTRRGKLMN